MSAPRQGGEAKARKKERGKTAGSGTWKCGSKKTKRYKGGEGLKWRMVNPFASVRPWSPLAVFPFPPSHLCSTKHGMQCSTSQYNLVFTPFELAVFPESAFLSSSNLSFFSRQIFLSSTPPSPYLSKACTPTLKVPDSLFISLASGYFFLFFFLVFEIHLQISSSHSSTPPPPQSPAQGSWFQEIHDGTS